MSLIRILIMLFALLIGSMAHAGEPARIVAIGDLHGDYEAYRDIALTARLIDTDGDWAGGETVLIQLGDITDRGPDSLKIIRDLMELEKQAEKAGGKVIVLLGNHEAMNVIGDLRYVHPGEFEAFIGPKSKSLRRAFWRNNEVEFLAKMQARFPDGNAKQWRKKWEEEHPLGWVEHRLAWQTGGELAKWYAGKPAIAKVGSTLFVHGGISVEVAAQGVDTTNAAIAAGLADRALMAPLENPRGPLWYRGNLEEKAGDRTVEMVRGELDGVLTTLGAKRLVVAHTPRLEGIDAQHDGRLVRIDTGMADHYGGRLSYLEILDGEAFAIEQDDAGKWARRALPQGGGS